jgi:hypothetical protein
VKFLSIVIAALSPHIANGVDRRHYLLERLRMSRNLAGIGPLPK